MMTLTSRVHKCASCDQFSKVLTCTLNLFTQSEVLLCPTCFAWRAKETERPARQGAWGSVHNLGTGLDQEPIPSRLAG